MSRRTAVAAGVTATALLAAAACGSSGGGTANQKAGSSAAGSAGASDASLHNQLPDSIKSSGVINFAVQQHPPYLVASGQTFSGPNEDLQKALAQVLGVRSQDTLVAGGLSPVLSGLLSKRYDAFAGPVEATPDREQQFDLVSWVVNKTSYIVDKSKTGSDITNLCGKTVAIISGSVTGNEVSGLSDYCVKNGKGSISQIALADTNSTILAVKTGRAVAAGTTSASAHDAVKGDPSLGVITQAKEQGGLVNNSCFIAPKGTGLGAVLEKAMQVLFKNGTYRKIMDRYDMNDQSIKEPQLNPPLDYTE